jgi:hypothetical protein
MTLKVIFKKYLENCIFFTSELIIFFLAVPLLGCSFVTKVIFTFENNINYAIFIPLMSYFKKKKFPLY